MNRLHFILLASLVSCPVIFAQDNGTNALPKFAIVSAQGADLFYDQSATVTGKVAQVTILPTIVFINLDEPYPNSPFAGVIFTKDTNKFSDLPKLKGQSVGITGTVKKYNGKPEIVVTNASQLKVLETGKK